jgi:hypothetical protein
MSSTNQEINTRKCERASLHRHHELHHIGSFLQYLIDVGLTKVALEVMTCLTKHSVLTFFENINTNPNMALPLTHGSSAVLSPSNGDTAVATNPGTIERLTQKLKGLEKDGRALENRAAALRARLESVATEWELQTQTALSRQRQLEEKLATAQAELATSQETARCLQQRLDNRDFQVLELSKNLQACFALLDRESDARRTLIAACQEYQQQSTSKAKQIKANVEILEARAHADEGGGEGPLVIHTNGRDSAPGKSLPELISGSHVSKLGTPTSGAERQTDGSCEQGDGELSGLGEGVKLRGGLTKNDSLEMPVDMESSNKRKRTPSEEGWLEEQPPNASQRRRIDPEGLKVAEQHWAAPQESTMSESEKSEVIASDSQAQAWLNKLSPMYDFRYPKGPLNLCPATAFGQESGIPTERPTFGRPSGPAIPIGQSDPNRGGPANQQLEVVSKNTADEANLFPSSRCGSASYVTVRSPGMDKPVTKRWKHSMLKKGH